MSLVRGALDLGIVVTDLDAALAFYTGPLGFAVSAKMDVPGVGPLAVIEVGVSRLRLIELAAGPKYRAEPGGVRVGATGLRYLGLEVDDLRPVYHRCLAAGARSVMAPTVIGSTVVGSVTDPDGNCVELLERIK